MPKPKIKRKQAIIAGWKEVIDLPDCHVFNLLAKLDTGANSSALDVSGIEEIEPGIIQFNIIASRKTEKMEQKITIPYSGKTKIKSSNGQIQNRYRISTTVQAGENTFEVEFTLVSRKSMICRALLGRKALAKRFLIDSDNKYLLGPRKKTKIKQKKHRK